MDDFENQLSAAYMRPTEPPRAYESAEAVMAHIARPASWRYPLLITAGLAGLALAVALIGVSGILPRLETDARELMRLIQEAQGRWWALPALALVTFHFQRLPR